MKYNKIIEWVIASSFILFALLLVCPIKDNQLGYEIIFSNYRLVIAFFSAIVGCLVLFLKKYINSVELLSITLLLISSIFYLVSIGEDLTPTPFVIIAIILGFGYSLILLYILNSENNYSVRDIVESAMLIALAVGLDLPGLKIKLGANGGSISFTMLPLFILALRLGTLKGFIGSGIVYGIITCLLDADGGGLNAYIFDYLLGYGATCIVGLFAKQILKDECKYTITGVAFLVVGVVLSVGLRLLASTFSGVLFWETPFVESLAYNALYVLPSGGVCLAALIVLYKPLMSINKKFPVKTTTL